LRNFSFRSSLLTSVTPQSAPLSALVGRGVDLVALRQGQPVARRTVRRLIRQRRN
jgi:hypothetical protein